MQYTYPEIRDFVMVCAGRVYVDYDQRIVKSKNTPVIITPRTPELGKILKNFLSKYNVKYKAEPGVYDIVFDVDVERIVFDMGQDDVIDTTVQEMNADADRMRNVGNKLLWAHTYRPKEVEEPKNQDKDAALDKLKKMIASVENVRSSDGGKYFYLFFPFFPERNIDQAKELFDSMNISVSVWISQLYGKPTKVLRIPSVMVPMDVANVINDLSRAATAHNTVNMNKPYGYENSQGK